jgi:hypothetical protein
MSNKSQTTSLNRAAAKAAEQANVQAATKAHAGSLTVNTLEGVEALVMLQHALLTAPWSRKGATEKNLTS